jgi:hypothetical protein
MVIKTLRPKTIGSFDVMPFAAEYMAAAKVNVLSLTTPVNKNSSNNGKSGSKTVNSKLTIKC